MKPRKYRVYTIHKSDRIDAKTAKRETAKRETATAIKFHRYSFSEN